MCTLNRIHFLIPTSPAILAHSSHMCHPERIIVAYISEAVPGTIPAVQAGDRVE